MKIKEIILEGFKSYSERTSLYKLDEQFNAITGFNGSGKSNILDAICFVLGLQSWRLARVENLRELIYKNGQAGIKQATVTIIFSNTDKNKKPINFEDSDEDIIVTRVIKSDQTEYRLNGKKVSNTSVKNMFRSIGLDIDNFNTFFVQQGKIMSIVNFQPKELMTFIEEAAGVSYYHQVKNNCVVQLDKNDQKMVCIDRKVDGDFIERLKKLEIEVKDFEKYQSVVNELNTMSAQLKFYEQKMIQNEEKKHKKLIETKTSENQELAGQKKELVTKHNALILKKQKLVTNLSEENIDKDFEKIKKDFDVKVKEYDQMIKQRKEIEEEISQLKHKQSKIEDELSTCLTEVNGLNLEKSTYQETIEKLQNQFDKIRVTLNSNTSNPTQVLKADLGNIQNECKELEDKKEEIKIRIKKACFLESELAEKKKKYQGLFDDHQRKIDNIVNDKRENELRIIELERLPLNETIYRKKINEIDEKLREINRKIQKNGSFMMNLMGINFDSHIPDNIRSRIYGRVHQLFDLTNDDMINALETVAEGKLSMIVVEDNETVTQILQNKYISGFNKYIPLNVVQANTMNPTIWTRANEIARSQNGEVYNPMELIKYDKRHTKAMEFVFGNKIITNDIELAGKIAFDKKVQKICISLDGSKVTPFGNLDGGYKTEESKILPRAKEQKRFEDERKRCEEERNENDKELQKSILNLDRLNKQKTVQRNLQEDEKAARDQLVKFNLGEINRSLNDCRSTIAQLNFEENHISTCIDENKQKTEKLRIQLRKSTNMDPRTFMENELENIKTERLKFEQLEKTKTSLIVRKNVQIDSLKSDCLELERIIEANKDRVFTNRTKEDEIKRTCEVLNEKIKANDEKYLDFMKKQSKIEMEKNDLEEEIKQGEMLLQKLTVKMQENQQSIDFSTQKLSEIVRKNQKSKALENEKMTDEEGNNLSLTELLRIVDELQSKIEESQKESTYLSKRINKESIIDYNQLSKKLDEVIKMRSQVREDRKVISSTLGDLDYKRDDSVQICFESVNKTFGNVFGSLLPGAFAEMVLEKYFDKKSDCEKSGVRIKISFNGKWKDSLSELSGGQRSLLALSFLLALLKYNPAPFYILDEIDSALDLSHTENLGTLISLEFPQSQFLVISLKEEFYNNANVLFKTSLVQSRSHVDRIQLKKVLPVTVPVK